MANTVFILGAGASREANAPLMSDFVQRMESIRQEGNAGWASQYFESERRARSKLQRALVKAQIKLDNVEDLFAAYETAKFIQRLSDLSAREIDFIPNSSYLE